MELNEERKKKLEAGKEKLAAFRKKKANRKKGDNEKVTASKDIIEPLNGGMLSPPEFTTLKDVYSTQEDNDQWFVSSGDEFSSEESESRSSEYYQSKLADARQRISTLEETVEGKQLALDSMMRDYERSNAQITPYKDSLKFDENDSNGLMYCDLEKALVQRDALIAQLTESLQTSTHTALNNSDMLQQIQILSEQVTELHNQLQETDQAMQEQTRVKDISSSALQAAKNQMLQLQTIVHNKDKHLQSYYEQLALSQDSAMHLQSEKERLMGDLSEKTRELDNLSQKLENSEHLGDVQSQWHEREKHFQEELVAKSEEITGLIESDRLSKAAVGELRDDNKEKDEKLQSLMEELEELKAVKMEIENESQELMKENKELTAFRQNISASLSDHAAITDEFDKLTHAHAALSAEHESLKSKCSLLESVADELRQENASSKFQLEELKNRLEKENHRLTEQEKTWSEMESRQSTYSDQLNNKLNDLQNRLSISAEALSCSEDALKEEKQQSLTLQAHLSDQLEQHSTLLAEVQCRDAKVTELEKSQQEYQGIVERLEAKERDFEKTKEELLGKSSVLESHLEELKKENKMLNARAVQLNDDLLTAQHVHGIEMSERDYRDNKMEEHMELMNEEMNAAVKRSSELESKVEEKENDLMAESGKRDVAEEQLRELEKQRDSLRETVQSLNVDIGQLKEELAVETKAPVEEKIMAYENLQLSSALKKKDQNETVEKVQITILEEEILSLKSKLDERESLSQNLEDKLHGFVSDYKEKLESSRLDICRLEQSLESQCSENDRMGKELTELKSTLEKTKDELAGHESSLVATKQELEEMGIEKMDLVSKKEKASTKVGELEREAENLKSVIETLQNREKELMRNQEAMDSQLEAAVGEWQKLQQIAQQKEIQMQKLEEDSEERERRWSSLERSHEEELSCLKSDCELLKGRCNEREVAMNESQAQYSDSKEELDLKLKELTEALKTIDERDSVIRDLEFKLSGIDSEMGNMFSENAGNKEEISQLLARLESAQDDIRKFQEETAHVEITLSAERKERDSLLEKLKVNEKELGETMHTKEEIERQVQDLHTELESRQSHINDLTSKLGDLSSSIADLEARCCESNDLLCKETLEKSLLSKSLDAVKFQGQRLEGLMASLTDDLHGKERMLVDQGTLLVAKTAEIDNLNEHLLEKEKALKVFEESNEALATGKESLLTDNQVLADENQIQIERVKKLENEALAHEEEAVQLSEDAKQLREELKQLREELKQTRQEAEGKDAMIHDLTHDGDMQRKEIADLKYDIDEKEHRIKNLDSDIDALQSALHTSDEEKKLLKTNFDACMEDMQQKSADQETELRQVKCQLAEESRSFSDGQNEMKEMFEIQLSQLEDKLLVAEREKTKLDKDILKAQENLVDLKESYENQMSELELSLQAANSECVRLNECCTKINTNYENEITDLKSLHEMQRSELLDNNTSLEKTVEELRKTVNKKIETARVERGDLEQSFEVQMLELDEKRRFSESEVGRLKRYLDEMRIDHENDIQNLEKRYETQLFELEDKCSIMGGELERARKSMMSVRGDIGEERTALELKVDDLENIRRELEIKISILDEDLSNLKAESLRREEEMKSILKNAAEKQTNMCNEICCLTEELSTLKAEKKNSLDSLQRKYETTIEDLETRKRHLETKVTSLEMHVEEDMTLRDQKPKQTEKEDLHSRISELRKQVGALSDENLSLKRRLMSRKSSDKKILSAGVEDILCPSNPTELETTSHSLPKLITSTPSKEFHSEDSFSPTVEEVSIIEGFVAERDQPLYGSINIKSFDEDAVGEPDFVAEERDCFQPEMVIEEVIESSEQGTRQLSMHPIREDNIAEEDITEGFQPEVVDHFLMETIVEPDGGIWPTDLSVGTSPTNQDKQLFHFNNTPSSPRNIIDRISSPDQRQANLNQNANCNVPEDCPDQSHEEEESLITTEELTRKLADLRDTLEEQHVTKMREQKRDIVVEYECKQETYQREMDLHFTQRAQSIKNDWERKFAKALQKVRKDVERHHRKETRQSDNKLKHAATASSPETVDEVVRSNNPGGEDGMPDIVEGSEALDERMQQLSRENQELAEARDELLKQIELSQTWGRHHRVQHELQSKISGRESPVSSPSPTETLTDDSPRREECPLFPAQATLTSYSPAYEEACSLVLPSRETASYLPAYEESIDSNDDSRTAEKGPSSDGISNEAGSSQAEMNETSLSGDQFVEEFTDISQQSSQDLPLEWELTMTLDEAGEYVKDLQQHGSIWEVFDGRCLRQDCQEQDSLKGQYESKLSTLQGHLDREREQNKQAMEQLQDDYQKVLSGFRDQLDTEQRSLLDDLISQLTKVHCEEIQDLEAKHERDVALEVTAWRVTLEQVYKSKNFLEASAVEAKHEKQLQEAQEKQKEKKEGALGKFGENESEAALTDQYIGLIQKINKALEERVLPEILDEETATVGHGGDVHKGSSQSFHTEIQNILLNQQQDIMSLRSQLLGDYESVLKCRAEDVAGQMEELQRQCDQQVAAFEQQLQSRDEEQKRISDEDRNKREEEQEQLKSHYEKRLGSMESTFEQEIDRIKDKYDEQISGLIHARLQASLGGEDSSTASSIHEDDSHSSSGAELTARLKHLEGLLADRDVEIKELRSRLELNESLDSELETFKGKVQELEKEVSSALSQCSKLEDLIQEKDSVIHNLEQEKSESEKLYRDLLEKESPRSKDSAAKDNFSGSSVDDSFSSARDDIQDTPRSFGSSEPVGLSDVAPDLNFIGEKKDDAVDDDNDIPFANESTEYNDNAGNNNNNNNNSGGGSSLDTSLIELKSRVDALSSQLKAAKETETALMLQVEETKHEHEDMIETLRHEMEHEKQVEVETLQSEFKIQLDIELRRQAAELLQNSNDSKTLDSEVVPEVSESVLCATSVALASSYPPKLTGDEGCDYDGLVAESSDSLLQTANFGLQTTATFPDSVDGNLSDDSKVTSLSPDSSLTDRDASAAPNLSLTDIEKEIQAMKDEYEHKLSQLRSQVEGAEEEKETLALSHQHRIEELERLLLEAEGQYDRLMDGVHNGEHPELSQLMKDKYDEELELAKILMQKDFDEMLTAEKKKFVELHRKLMADFMEDKATEDEVTKGKHTKELELLKTSLEVEYNDQIQGYEQEIERLNRDLDLLREVTPRTSDSGRNSTLPEIDEITLNFQNNEVESESPGSEDNVDTSTPDKEATLTPSPEGVEYEESDDEKDDQIETLQIRTFADVLKSPSPCVLKENEDLQLKVDQLTAQVERLTSQLAFRMSDPTSSSSPQPPSPKTSPHNSTLQAEDPALIAMLQSDLDRIGAEREAVQQTNERLLSLLSDTVKTYIGVEDTINRKLTQVVSNAPRPTSQSDSGERSRPASVELGLRHAESLDSRHGSPAPDRRNSKAAAVSPDPDTSHDSHGFENTSILSNATDEGLEISQRLAESIFIGPDLDEEGEEILSDARGRLTSAVSQLLELMERSTVQLVEARATQADLLNTLAQRAREVELSTSRCSELDSQLSSEIEAKEYLGLELHKAEGLIAGYTAERDSHDNRIQTLEEQREALIIQLDSTRSRLEDFERSQSEIDSAREDLTHQQTLLRENAGQETQEEEQERRTETDEPTPALLTEVSSLNQEKRELTNQLQHQLDLSRKRLTELEALAEEVERKQEAALEEKNRCIEDMRLQLENTERQLKASKSFVNEQMTEREQERDEHQREVEKLQEMMESKDRRSNSQQRLQREIADLTEQLQSRISAQESMHQRIVDLQGSLEDKEISTKDLKVWVSELEGQLDLKGSMEEQLKQKITRLERQLTQTSDNMETEEEIEATEGTLTESAMKKHESPTVMSPVRQGPRPSLISLEEELQKSKLTKEELDQENNALKQQLHQQMLQISGLRNQIDQLRHYASEDDSDTVQLRLRLQEVRDKVEQKEGELTEAESKIEKLEGILQTKQQEAESLSERVSCILEMGETQVENQSLKTQLEELQSQMHTSSSASTSLPTELLAEKNEEISELKGQLQIIQAEVEKTDEENLNHQGNLRLLQQQLKERDEEITDLQDSLTSIRRGEACLDVSLPLTDEVGSMLNLSMTGRTTRSTRPVTPTSIQQEFEETISQREGEVHSLEERLAAIKAEADAKTQEAVASQANLAEKESELDSMKLEVSEKQEEIEKLQQELISAAGEIDELKVSLGNLQRDKDSLTDQEKMVESLDESVEQKEREVYELTMEMTEVKQQLQEVTDARDDLEKLLHEKEMELIQTQEERDEKRELLQEKDHKFDQMIIQIDSLQQETASLTTFQNELQKDFDTVQTMLDEKEKEIETLTREMTDTKTTQEDLDSMGNVKGDLDTVQQELKQANDALQKEKQEKSDLEEQLSNKQESIQQLEEQITTLAGDVESLQEKCTKIQTLLEDRNVVVEDQTRAIQSSQDSLTEKDTEISKLKVDLTQAEEDTKALQQEKDKLIEQHQAKLKDIEEQLQVQDANFLAMQLTSERNESIRQEIEKLKQQTTEKDSTITVLENQLKEERDESTSTVEALKKQLTAKDEEMQETGSLRRQLEETEEQLRFRQSVVLEVQGENEQLVSKMEEMDKLRHELEEKDKATSELESQLRYRQSALLDLEAEKERLVEEKAESEEKYRRDMEEGEKEFETLQTQFIQLRDGMKEEVLHMEHEMQKSSQARVIKRSQEMSGDEVDKDETINELENKLEESSAEITKLIRQLKSTDEKMAVLENQFSSQQDDSQELQSELSRLHEENGDLKSHLQELELNVKELQNALEATQKHKKNEAVLLEVGEDEKCVEIHETMLSESRPSLYASSPTECDSGAVFVHHSSSELSSLEVTSRNHVNELQAHVAELEKVSDEQRMQLLEKREQLEELRSELVEATEGRKDQRETEELIQDKEGEISALNKEVKEMKTQMEEQENLLMSLRDELDISTMTHQEQISSRDDQIADLQGQVQILRVSSPLTSQTTSPSGADTKSLSPQTKHQISHLKTQLRKAHAALEEMQSGQGMRESFDSVDSASPSPQLTEVEELRRKVQEQEEELVQLRSRLDSTDGDIFMMDQKLEDALAEQKQELEKQHNIEMNELLSQPTPVGNVQQLERSDESMGSSVSLVMSDSSMPARVKALLTRLNEASEDLLSATDFALLQQCLSQPRSAPNTPESLAWSEERRRLMDTILAVKELLGDADRFSIEPLEELSGDWRADLLQALVKVYEKERQVLRAEVGTADSMYPELDIISQLENRIHDLERVHQDGLDEIIKADRQSLLDEIDSLHHSLMDSRSHLHDARQELDERIASLEDARNKMEWKLKHQIQLLEHKMQQEQVIQKDLKKSIILERQRVSELSSESSQDRSKILELQSDLSSTQIHLSKVKDALEREQQRFSSVTDALEEEHAKTVHLSEILDTTRKKLHNLQDESAHSMARQQQLSDSEGVFIKELQMELEKERERSQQFSEAEEQAQSQIARLSDKLEALRNKLTSIQQDYEDKVESLHRELMEKELHHRTQSESEAFSSLTELLDAERQSHQKSLDLEKNTTRKLKLEIEELQMENGRLISSYDMEKSRADNLKQSLEMVQREKQTPTAETKKRLQKADSDTSYLQRKVSELENELGTVQERARQLETQLNKPRTDRQNGQSSSMSGTEQHRNAVNSLVTASVVDEEMKYRLAQCCTKLQIVGSKLQDMTDASHQQGSASTLREGAVKVVMDELSKLKSDIRLQGERMNAREQQSERDAPPEQLLQHNQQMAEHIIKLKKEKEHMTNMLKSLESRMQKTTTTNHPSQMNLPLYTSDITSDEDGVYDRTMWASEKLSLQMALDSAEHEIQRLRTELRRYSSLMKSDGQLMKMDPDKTQRLYGKYLRAESFRKALIYQKKYLLLLLGGYRDTEQETLVILASMGGHPSSGLSIQGSGVHSKCYTTFRSAGRVVIAIFRMKYLVRKWKRATRVGSPVMTGQISNQHAYVPPSSLSYSLPQRQHSSHRHPTSSTGSVVNTQSSGDYIETLTNGGISSLHSSSSSTESGPTVPTNYVHLKPYTTPPTKESPRQQKAATRSGKESARRQILQDFNDSDKSNSQTSSARVQSHPTESSDDNFLRYLEKVQKNLSEDPSSVSSRRSAWR